MADETADLIEETQDEINNWMYYTNEPPREECSDLNTFSDGENDQELIYADYRDQVVNNNEQVLEYDPDNLVNIDENQNNALQVKKEFQKATNNEDDTSKHSLILKETIDENGQLVEEYYCQHCSISFSSIEEFFSNHPSMEILNDNILQEEEEKQEIVQTLSKDKLWDLVENLEENNADEVMENVIEYKPNVSEQNTESVELDAVELEKERYFCYDCQQVFGDLITAENHDCGNHLESSKNLAETKSNLFVDTANNVYRCNLCDKDFESLRSFNNHQRAHKKNENPLGHITTFWDEAIICEICNTIFSSKKNLKLHMKMHKKHVVKTIQEALPVGAQDEYNELSQFFCEICNKSFDQKLLVIHKNMHQNLEEYCCGKCNKQFENLPSYEIHMQMHMDNETKSKKVISTKKNIAEETPSTSAQAIGKRKHACQYCGKEFLRPYEKVKHERIHTGEKPYECEVCGKTFRVSYSLTLHLRTHTDIRPYVCATCNKRFKQQSVYVHHLKTHIVERGYKCEICGKSFRTSVQLSGHKNIHSKPYNCTECNRPFASLYSVKTHMKTHNKGHKANKNLKNRCNICGASYARLFALRYHIKEQHGIEVDPTKLLASSVADGDAHNEIDAETALLMNVAHEASTQDMHFINGDDGEGDDDEESVINEDHVVYNNQIDHEENIQNSLRSDLYLDETEAATQTILNTEEISVDHFSNEETITDWLSK